MLEAERRKISYRVQIALLDLRKFNISVNQNHVEVYLCVGRLLLMSEIERRVCCTKFESHGGRVMHGSPKTYRD